MRQDAEFERLSLGYVGLLVTDDLESTPYAHTAALEVARELDRKVEKILQQAAA